jgi:hypothetical protein
MTMRHEPLTEAERAQLKALAEQKGVIPAAEEAGLTRIALLQLLSGLPSRAGTLLQARQYLQGAAGARDTGVNASTIKRGE